MRYQLCPLTCSSTVLPAYYWAPAVAWWAAVPSTLLRGHNHVLALWYSSRVLPAYYWAPTVAWWTAVPSTLPRGHNHVLAFDIAVESSLLITGLPQLHDEQQSPVHYPGVITMSLLLVWAEAISYPVAWWTAVPSTLPRGRNHVVALTMLTCCSTVIPAYNWAPVALGWGGLVCSLVPDSCI